MNDRVELRDERASLVILPGQGGGIARFDALATAGAAVPLLKPPPGGVVACELLVPWSNRISGGGFEFDGRFHAVAPNVAGEPFPLHGDGFQKAWRLARQTATQLELVLEDGAIGPYRYVAYVSYSLHDGALEVTLTVENRAAIRLPYGLGFHPWLPRHPGTTLAARAERVWLEDQRHLPTGVEPLAAHPAWNFAEAAPLPAGWINNGFDGWDGRARVVQPEDDVTLSMEASPELGAFILYSPSPDAGFFCLEPVSHPVDAHHGQGLTALDPGENMSVRMGLSWRPLDG